MVGFYPRGSDRLEFWENYWKMLHLVTYLYPENPTDFHKKQISELAERLSTNLPYKCKRCISHYRANLIKYPLSESYSSRESLTRWLIDIHNSVNKSRQRPVLSYEKVDAMYSDLDAVNNSLVEAYDLDVKNYINDPSNKWCLLVHIGHRKIIDKIIANYQARQEAAKKKENINEVLV